MRLVETGHTAAGDEQLAAAAEEYLAPMRERGVCALLLGCTHFDFAADAIRECGWRGGARERRGLRGGEHVRLS